MKERVEAMAAGIIRGFHIYNDTILGGFLTVVSAYLFASSFSIKIMKAPISSVDTPRFFPQLVFGALIPIGIVLVVRGLLKAKRRRETAPSGERLGAKVLALKRSIVALLAIVIFIAGMEPVGYIPMAVLYMLFNMFYMCEREAWRPVLFLTVSIAVALLSYFLFRQFVYVRLPAGVLKGVLGA